MEKILGVAIKHDGVVHKLPAPNRHFHLLHKMATRRNGVILSSIAAGQQGFYTDERDFIDRKEAKRLAVKNGHSGPPHTLFSEDVW